MTAAKFKSLNGAVHRMTAEERDCIKDEIASLRSQLQVTPVDEREPIIAAISRREYELRGRERSRVFTNDTHARNGARYLTK